MTNSERDRHELLARLQDVLGHEQAATLMENLPPQPWSELTTKDDLAPIKADVAVLKTDVAGLKTDVAGIRTTMESNFEHLHAMLEMRFTLQASHMEAFVRERLDSHTKLMFFSMIGAVLTTAGIALGSAAL